MEIWRFSDGKAGHDAQSLGLIRALTRLMDCRIHDIPPLSASHCLINILRRRFTAGDAFPPPHFLIGAGHATHAGMLCARRARGGIIILLMKPSLPLRWFDLCLIPDHDDPPLSHPRVIRTRGPLNELRAAPHADPGCGLILLGGISRHFHWSESSILEQIITVCAKGGNWTLTDSRRTPASTRNALKEISAQNIKYVPYNEAAPDWLKQQFQECGSVWVTPDSMAMVHEALTAGAAVGVFHLPPRGENKLSRAIRKLATELMLVQYDAWVTGQPLVKASAPLNEAERCAQLIIERFGLTEDFADYGSSAPTPFVAGLISLAQHCPHHWLGKQLALILRKIVVLNTKHPLDTAVGPIRLRCYLHDNVSERKFLFMPWLYDPRERSLITQQLPTDGVFVDIGANVGIYTLWACQSLSSQGLVIAVEPNPRVYDRLLYNLRINQITRTDWPRVRTLPIAISDNDGILDLIQDRTNLGAGSLVSHPVTGEKIQVPGRPLLSVLAECGVERIDILKIDIEGAEDIALTPLLITAGDRLLPRYLIIENSEHLWRSDLVSVLKRRGYAVAFRTRMNTVYKLLAAASTSATGILRAS